MNMDNDEPDTPAGMIASSRDGRMPALGVFFAVVNTVGRLTALSDSFESHLGYESRHLTGSRATRIFPEADLDWLNKVLSHGAQTSLPY